MHKNQSVSPNAPNMMRPLLGDIIVIRMILPILMEVSSKWAASLLENLLIFKVLLDLYLDLLLQTIMATHLNLWGTEELEIFEPNGH